MNKGEKAFSASLKRFLPDPFIAGLLFMILLAGLCPGAAMGDFKPNLSHVIDAGITLIFFFYGLKLNLQKIRQGMSNWRLHLSVQLTTFLIFPLCVLPFYPLCRGTEAEVFWYGIFFLAALPSTVSSSVVMVSMAKGNVPAAIFNATLSGMIGILVTPLWMGLVLAKSGGMSGFSGIIIQLFTQIILPVFIGLLLHRYFEKWVNRHLHQLAWFDKSIILLIVYESFSNSFLSGIFRNVSPVLFLPVSGCVILLFFAIFYATRYLAHFLKFNREDSIVLQFSGSKKSLVHGSVFASVLFQGISGSGIYLMPIMIYHAFQLTYISVVAQKMQKEVA